MTLDELFDLYKVYEAADEASRAHLDGWDFFLSENPPVNFNDPNYQWWKRQEDAFADRAAELNGVARVALEAWVGAEKEFPVFKDRIE